MKYLFDCLYDSFVQFADDLSHKHFAVSHTYKFLDAHDMRKRYGGNSRHFCSRTF